MYKKKQKSNKFFFQTRTFEQLHHLQVQTFEKTIHDCQIENERLCERINDLTRELNEKKSIDEISREKVLVRIRFFFRWNKNYVDLFFSLDLRSYCCRYTTLATETRFL